MAARGMWWAAQHVQAARAVSGLSPTLSEYSAANTLQTTHDGLHSVKNRHSSSWRGRWASRCAKQEHKHEKNERLRTEQNRTARSVLCRLMTPARSPHSRISSARYYFVNRLRVLSSAHGRLNVHNLRRCVR